MRLAFLPRYGQWALVDEAGADLRHVSGGLAAWAPRIAGGEGVGALPLNGRVTPPGPLAALSAPGPLRRILPGPREASAGRAIAAVIGVTLTGRRNPVRSLCGYVAAYHDPVGRLTRLGTVMVTRGEFGDAAPLLVTPDTAGDGEGAADFASYLTWLDSQRDLRIGDVVMLGAAALSARQWMRLEGGDLADPAETARALRTQAR
jgi:hypothetical protein